MRHLRKIKFGLVLMVQTSDGDSDTQNKYPAAVTPTRFASQAFSATARGSIIFNNLEKPSHDTRAFNHADLTGQFSDKPLPPAIRVSNTVQTSAVDGGTLRTTMPTYKEKSPRNV